MKIGSVILVVWLVIGALAAYQRNYFSTVHTGGDSRQPGSGYGERAAGWDLISEWILPDEAALHEIYRIMQTPGIDELFHADEDRFIDRTATMTIHCEVRDTGTVFDPRGTVFDTPTPIFAPELLFSGTNR